MHSGTARRFPSAPTLERRLRHTDVARALETTLRGAFGNVLIHVNWAGTGCGQGYRRITVLADGSQRCELGRGRRIRAVRGTGRGLRGVSSPGEFHPEALVEPDVNVSAHPALIIQPRTNGFVLALSSSLFRLTQR